MKYGLNIILGISYMTKLQLALDVLTTEAAIELATQTQEYIDIIEIGSPLIKHEGLRLVIKMRELFPDKELLVDLKTMDVGEYESDFCFKAGADIVTVLGAADIETVKGSIKSAKKHGKKVMVDMINVDDKVILANIVSSLGADYVGIHSGIDQQLVGGSPLKDLQAVKEGSEIPVIVAGGINIQTIDAILEADPDVVVVGGAITSSPTPAISAKAIKDKIDAYNQSQNLNFVDYEVKSEQRPIGLDLLKVIRTSLDNAEKSEFLDTMEALSLESRIFIAGAGRSGLIGKIFGMRLMHLGMEVFIVGETTTPAIEESDLLVIISASGKTSSLVNIAKNAHEMGVSILGITANKTSPIYTLASNTIHIDNRNKNKRNETFDRTNRNIPMGTSFEISALIYLETLITELMKAKNISEDEMKSRHINL